MANEVELYKRRKQEQRTKTAAPDEATTLAKPEDYVVRKQERRQQNAALVAAQAANIGDFDANAEDTRIAADYKTLINPEVTAPSSFVRTNRDRMQADLSRYRMTTTLASSPMLTRWLGDVDNVRVAGDDTEILANIEAGLGHARDALKRGVVDRGGQVFSQVRADALLYGARQVDTTFAERYRRARGENYGHGFFGAPGEPGNPQPLDDRGADPLGAFFSAAVGGAVGVANELRGNTSAGNVARAAEWQQQAAEFAKRAAETPVSPTAQRALDALHSDEPLSMRDAAKRTLDLAVSDPGALVAMIAEVGTESVGSMIPAAVATIATRNPAIGAATMGGTSYAVERNLAPVEFFLEKGYDLTKEEDVGRMLANPELMKEAAELGHTRGLIIGALDWVSGGVAGRALARNPVADAALQALVQGGLGGGGEGLAQYATEGTVDFGEVVVEALAEFSTAPIDVAAIGARKLGERKSKAARAAATAEAVEKLSADASVSKLRERSPEKFRAFVESATKDGDMETMYVPADAFVGFFQSQGITLEQAAEALPGVDINQLQRAAATGEDVTIPTATYMERIAGSEMDAFIADNAKFSPDEMTRAEAQAFAEDEVLEEARVAAAQEAARVVREANSDLSAQIETEITDQLVAAGRSRVAAQQEAQLFPAFYKALADRMGTTLEAVVKRYRPPVVRGPEVSPLQDKSVDEVTRDLAGMQAWMNTPEKLRTESEAEYFGAVEQSVRAMGLDPATATEEEVRAALGEGLRQEVTQDEVNALADTAKEELGLHSMSVSLSPGRLKLNMIAVPKGEQGKGAGTEAMRRLAAFADANGLRVELTTGQRDDGFGTTSATRLKKFYKRFGFVENKGRNKDFSVSGNMYREPRSTELFQPAPPVDSEAFKEWFGDSKVVDENGEPLVVYHGTNANAYSDGSFSVFSTRGERGGAFFSSSAETAGSYGEETYPVYLNMKNPLVVDAGGAGWSSISAEAAVSGEGLTDALAAEQREANAKDRKLLDEILADLDEWDVGDASDVAAPQEPTPGTLASVAGTGADVDAIAKRARKLGFDGLVVRNVKDGPVADSKQVVADTYVVFGATQIKSAEANSGAFDPSDPNIYQQGERGRILIPGAGIADGQSVIDLFKNADLSTFLHESSHFFLSVLQDAAAAENAPQAVKDMHAQATTWWRENAAAVAKEADGITEADVIAYLDSGTTGDAGKDTAVNVGLQEQWARAFETYLLEGKAPTAKLRAAFEQFRAWLMEVYRKVKGNLNVTVTDDIRQVFDMLLATDEELQQAEVDNSGDMLAKTAAELGVSEDDYAKLAELHREARDEAATRAIRETMAPIRRMREAAYRARREEIRAEVEAEVNARPVYRAIEWLGNKRWLGLAPDDQPDVPTGMRLNKEQLVDRYGPGVLRTLPRGSFRVYTPGGMDIDEAAGWFGYSSGDELVQAMEAAPRRVDVVANETDRRAMAELAADDSIATAANAATEAFHTDKRGDYIAAELRTLNIKIGGKTGTSTASYARQVAKRTLAGMAARDAVASNRFLAAERRAAEAAQVAFVGGDLRTATDQKRKQLFNHMMYTESRRIVDEVAKTERLAKRLNGKSARKNLASEYMGAIDDILEQYDFRKTTRKKEDNRARMLAYVDMMKAQGRENEIAIPQHVLENAKAEPYMTLPVERLRGVYATLKNVESTARRAQKLIDAKREREMDQIANDIGDAFTNNIKSRPPGRVDTKGERMRRGARQFFDLVLNADTLLREVDGFKDGEGAAYENLKRGIDEATARLQVRRQEAATEFERLYSVYETKERNQMAVSKFVPELGVSMSKWDLIAVVLNMGNEDNIQRLTDPKVKGAFTQAQLDSVLGLMDQRDMDFVQSVWDYVGSFYQEIAAREKRVTGVAPQRVEPMPLNTPHGQYRGGYYPIKYDPRLSSRVAEETAEDVMNNMRAGRFGKAQTKNGHTKERASSSGRPVMLDIGVLHSHVNTVLHDLELSEEVTNAWRILQDPRVKGLFYDAGRQVDHQALEMWVQDVASGQVNSADVLSKTARFMKSGFTVSKLAFNLSTVAVQLTGVAQSMVVIGKKDFTKGAAMYAAHPVETSQDVVARSEFMRERETTFNKDIYDIMGDIKVGPKAGLYKRAMQNWIGPASFYLMQKVQFYGVDMPTWLGAYQKALGQTGNDEAASILAADRAVARAQASGIFSDRSPIERGTLTPTVRQNDFVRMFTALGSYMFAKANVAYERTAKTDFRSPREVLAYTIDMVLLFTVEAILYNAIKGTLPGMGDDDDEGWAEFLTKETALSVMSTMPFVRDLASPLQGYSGGGSYGSISETLTKPFLQAAQGEIDKPFVKSLVDAGGMLLHLPSTQVNRFIDAGWRTSEGEDVAPIEFIMGKR